MARYRRIFVWLLLLTALGAGSAEAQTYFGRNKVHYAPLDWCSIETPHFQIYYYKEEEAIGRLAASIAESAYTDLSQKFLFSIGHKVPVILYSTHALFQETNVTSDILPEGVGGFTEYLKGRVVVPYSGSRAEFRHVLKHELVHVFTLERIRWGVDAQNKFFFAFPPLWFVEGLAEHWSTEWSPIAEGLVRNEVLHGGFNGFQDLDRIAGSYAMYKGGESVFRWLEETRGEGAIRTFFEEYANGRNFYDLWEIATGEEMEVSGEKWGYWLKKSAFPKLDSLDFPELVGRAITPEGQNLSPTGVFDVRGTDTLRGVVYKANLLGYSGVYLTTFPDGDQEKLLTAEMSEDFESIHLFRNRMSVDGGEVMLSIKRGAGDRLILLDLRSGDIVRQREFPELQLIISPCYDAVRQRTVFAAAGPDGLTDIYLWDMRSDSLTRLTSDPWDESDPIFTPDGSGIIFASDRNSTGPQGESHLFRLELASRKVLALTTGPWHDTQPTRLSDSLMAFVSDRDGVQQVWLRRGDGALARATNWSGGMVDFATYRGDTLIATAFVDQRYGLIRFTLPDSLRFTSESFVTPTLVDQVWHSTNADSAKSRFLGYHPSLSLELAQGTMAMDDASETGGGIAGYLSDVLGDQAIYFFLLSDQNLSWGNFLDNFSLIAAYINRQHRLNWSAGAYRLRTQYWDRIQGSVDEREIGLTGSLSYPLSRFHRFDLNGFLRYSDREVFPYSGVEPERVRKATLGTATISYIRDTAIWGITGPVDGYSTNLTFGVTTDFRSSKPLNTLMAFDGRYYVRLARSVTWAHRVMARTSAGPEPDRYFLGGTFTLRGYSFFSLYGRNLLLLNTEVRFPLIPSAFIHTPLLDLGLYGVKGAFFVDAGAVWEDRFPARPLGAVGFSLRVPLAQVLLFRFDWAKRTDFRTIEPSTRFDFFFGWDY